MFSVACYCVLSLLLFSGLSGAFAYTDSVILQSNSTGEAVGWWVDIAADVDLGLITAAYAGESGQGVVYLIEPSTGNVRGSFEAENSGGYGFGISCAISDNGDTIVIGYPYGTVTGVANWGQVYVYKNVTQTLAAYDTSVHVNFTADHVVEKLSGYIAYLGYSVSLSGDGRKFAASEHDAVSGQGYAHYYDVESMTKLTLTETNVGGVPSNGDAFGRGNSLSTDGLSMVVSACIEYQSSSYIVEFDDAFDYNVTGTVDSIPQTYQGLNPAISGDGEYVALGSPRTSYVYSFDGLAQIVLKNGTIWKTLYSPNPVTNGYFGYTVAMDREAKYVVIGAYNAGSGRAYLTDVMTENTCVTELVSSEATTASFFGISLAVNQDLVWVGARTDGDALSTVYAFQVSSGDICSSSSSATSSSSSSMGTSTSTGVSSSTGISSSSSSTGVPVCDIFAAGECYNALDQTFLQDCTNEECQCGEYIDLMEAAIACYDVNYCYESTDSFQSVIDFVENTWGCEDDPSLDSATSLTVPSTILMAAAALIAVQVIHA